MSGTVLDTIYLLLISSFFVIDSRSECKRRAKCIPRTLNPEWHRTLVFLNVPRGELPNRTLDVSVWDRDRLFPDQLLGRVVLELSGSKHRFKEYNSDTGLDAHRTNSAFLRLRICFIAFISMYVYH